MTWIRSLSLLVCALPWTAVACGSSSGDGLFEGSGGAPSTGGTSPKGGASNAGGSTSGSGSATAGTVSSGGSSNDTGGRAGSAGTSNGSDCETLQHEAEALLDAARVCEPSEGNQCETKVPDLCGCDTRIARYGSDAMEAYMQARKRFADAGCSLACLTCLGSGSPGCTPSERPRCSRSL